MTPIGHLVTGRVVRAYPDRQAYLIWLHESNGFAVLPKQYADRAYKVKDAVSAAVFRNTGDHPVLSQRSAPYFRRITEAVLAPVIHEEGVHVHRVATVERANFVKVALKHADPHQNPVLLCLSLVQSFSIRTSLTVSLVRYLPKLEDYIVAALNPAPARSVRRVELYREERRARVIVEKGTISYFLGKAAMNVAAASKLTGIAIQVFDESELHRLHTF